MAEPSPSFNPNPRKPKIRLPHGACDTHFHVFGPRARFPFSADRSYTPTCDAPKETLFALHKHLGIERGVVVQSAAHGLTTRPLPTCSPPIGITAALPSCRRPRRLPS
jgi:2-pyrone-4,6-dicarboxylate lactonase